MGCAGPAHCSSRILQLLERSDNPYLRKAYSHTHTHTRIQLSHPNVGYRCHRKCQFFCKETYTIRTHPHANRRLYQLSVMAQFQSLRRAYSLPCTNIKIIALPIHGVLVKCMIPKIITHIIFLRATVHEIPEITGQFLKMVSTFNHT